MGIADSGHYYSYINDREFKREDGDSEWYEFNDHRVRSFDPADIPKESFGGDETF